MKGRCLSPTHAAYENYGGRGIDIDPRWVESFKAFLADVGPKPSPELSLDRINNDLGYWPGNVQWATKLQQTTNRRPCRRKLTPTATREIRAAYVGGGVTQTELAAEYGVSRSNIARIVSGTGPWATLAPPPIRINLTPPTVAETTLAAAA
jgi:hypothetical protein